MTLAAESVARLVRIAAACREARPLEPKDAVALTIAIDSVARGAVRSLDEALGLSPRRGQRRAGTELARQHRDALLRKCAETHFRGMSRRAQASALWSAVRRHRTVSHHRDQDAAPGTLRCFLSQLAEMNAMLGLRQLEKILSAN